MTTATNLAAADEADNRNNRATRYTDAASLYVAVVGWARVQVAWAQQHGGYFAELAAPVVVKRDRRGRAGLAGLTHFVADVARPLPKREGGWEFSRPQFRRGLLDQEDLVALAIHAGLLTADDLRSLVLRKGRKGTGATLTDAIEVMRKRVRAACARLTRGRKKVRA